MNTYQQAADALKAAVKASLDQDVDSNLQSEIWRHYQGMQNIANQLEHKESFSLSGVMYDPDENIQFTEGPFAADTVSLGNLTFGDDIISFGDYKSQEYRPD